MRCMSCNQLLASKYLRYKQIVKKKSETISSNNTSLKETHEESAFKKLGLKRYCCRRHFLGHVDIIQNLT